jgi:hypothetical protein
VCVKVVDDIKTSYAKLAEATSKGNKVELAEKALGKHCGLKSLSAKDHKLVRAPEALGRGTPWRQTYDWSVLCWRCSATRWSRSRRTWLAR